VIKSLDDRSDDELESGLLNEEFNPRKKATAEEILRRRYEAKGAWGWLGNLWPRVLGALGSATSLLHRLRGAGRRQRPSA
jgi:hypothetical protein